LVDHFLGGLADGPYLVGGVRLLDRLARVISQRDA
jgi:hypothetical protein